MFHKIIKVLKSTRIWLFVFSVYAVLWFSEIKLSCTRCEFPEAAEKGLAAFGIAVIVGLCFCALMLPAKYSLDKHEKLTGENYGYQSREDGFGYVIVAAWWLGLIIFTSGYDWGKLEFMAWAINLALMLLGFIFVNWWRKD